MIIELDLHAEFDPIDYPHRKADDKTILQDQINSALGYIINALISELGAFSFSDLKIEKKDEAYRIYKVTGKYAVYTEKLTEKQIANFKKCYPEKANSL